jgi:DNA-binding winged helix-turn-helix (wHTH) protein/predicted Zn-dependent protease
MHERNSTSPVSDTPEFLFAGFHLDSDGTLFRGETPVHLPPKELAALKLLIANAGRIVTPLELQKALWGDIHVTGDSVPKCVSSLRARLQPEDCIQTVYKRGYRFTCGVRTRGQESASKLPRLAVLPFTTGYGVSDHLGPVIAEEAIAHLGTAWPAVAKVLARDSVFTLARRGLTAQQTGEALQADLALTGTISAMSMHYRLRIEMVRVEDGTQIWVEDVLVRRDVVAAVESQLVSRLALRLGSKDAPWLRAWHDDHLSLAAAAGKNRPGDQESGSENADRLEAYEVYQRAHNEWQSLQRHRMQDGLQHLMRATELDPSLIGARVDLINLCISQCFYGFMSPAAEANLARRTVETLPDLPSRSEAVLPALAWISFHFDRNLPEALNLMSMSSHLPHDPWITRTRSMLAMSRHQFDAAIGELKRAIELDPFAPWLHARLAWALHLAGRATESVEQVKHTLNHFPEHEGASLYGAAILAYNGSTERAISLAQELTERLPYFDLASSVLAYTLAAAGRHDEARSLLERLQWLGRERFFIRSFLPAAHIALGDPQSALAELRAADENRCPWFYQMLADPRLQPLHGNPEFEAMRASLAEMEAEAARDTEPVH